MQKKNIIPILTLSVVCIIAVLLGGALFYLYKIDTGITRLTGAVKNANQPESRPQPREVNITADDDPVIGDPKAKTSIILFLDYECSFCSVFYEKLYGNLSEDFIKPGKINLVFKDYPLSIHPNAMNAAMAAECADEQGKFEEMFTYLFENPKALKNDEPLAWAEKTGLDTGSFSACMASEATEAEIQKDIDDANSSGVLGTPAFVIGGKLYIGTRPYQDLKVLIENTINENETFLSPAEVRRMMEQSEGRPVLIDVRTADEFSAGQIEGAVNLDVRADDFTEKIKELEKDAEIVLYCKGNTRSGEAFQLMKKAGFLNVFRLKDGFTGWEKEN